MFVPNLATNPLCSTRPQPTQILDIIGRLRESLDTLVAAVDDVGHYADNSIGCPRLMADHTAFDRKEGAYFTNYILVRPSLDYQGTTGRCLGLLIEDTLVVVDPASNAVWLADDTEDPKQFYGPAKLPVELRFPAGDRYFTYTAQFMMEYSDPTTWRHVRRDDLGSR